MKPKLIIINGPCGIGKTTIAELYKNDHPMSLLLDVDEIRRFLGSYRERKEESHKEAHRLAYVITREHLSNGYDVIISNFIKKISILDEYKKIAEDCNADFYEFLLWADKEKSLARAVKRGFRPGGLLQENKLESMYDELEKVLVDRINLIRIESKEGEIEETYKKIIEKL